MQFRPGAVENMFQEEEESRWRQREDIWKMESGTHSNSHFYNYNQFYGWRWWAHDKSHVWSVPSTVVPSSYLPGQPGCHHRQTISDALGIWISPPVPSPLLSVREQNYWLGLPRSWTLPPATALPHASPCRCSSPGGPAKGGSLACCTNR